MMSYKYVWFMLAKLVEITPITIGLLVEVQFMRVINQLVAGGQPPYMGRIGGEHPRNE